MRPGIELRRDYDAARLRALAKATRHRVNLPQYGMSWEHEGSNAIQADWRMEHLA
jgi:hypothetical protein